MNEYPRSIKTHASDDEGVRELVVHFEKWPAVLNDVATIARRNSGCDDRKLTSCTEEP